MQVSLINNKLKISYFLYEIVHHCILNCRGCDHCAPLAEPEFVSLKKYEKDIKQMKRTFDEITSIGIMGGEPLLHNKINEILCITRKILPYTKIALYTNGILLDKKEDIFWETLKENKIILNITRYKINTDYEKLEEMAKKYNIFFNYTDNTDRRDKLFCKIKFDLAGMQRAEESHSKCHHASNFPTLEDGKLYKCSIITGSRHFNKYFKTDMKISKQDYIDIYEKNKKEDIVKYFEEAIPFCKYCDVKSRIFDIEWNRSNKKISEWT